MENFENLMDDELRKQDVYINDLNQLISELQTIANGNNNNQENIDWANYYINELNDIIEYIRYAGLINISNKQKETIGHARMFKNNTIGTRFGFSNKNDVNKHNIINDIINLANALLNDARRADSYVDHRPEHTWESSVTKTLNMAIETKKQIQNNLDTPYYDILVDWGLNQICMYYYIQGKMLILMKNYPHLTKLGCSKKRLNTLKDTMKKGDQRNMFGGRRVYSGPRGGRYYKKGGRKVYV
jgi:hypothetical protein